MKITDVKTILLTGPCTNDPFLSKARRLRSASFIEIRTDTGHTGLGETYAGYFVPEMVPEVVEFYKPILVGQDVSDIPGLWRRMYVCGSFWARVGLGIAVLSGIEAALWDLKGKLENKPVYELLGGRKHERVRAYATGGPANYPKDELARKIDFYLSLGFNAFKISAGAYYEHGEWFMPPTPQETADFEADKLAFIRARYGDDVGVLVDGHMGFSEFEPVWHLETASAVLKAMEPFHLVLFEEALPYTEPWAYSELCHATSTPVAGGESLTGEYEWRVFCDVDAFDIGQPDAAFIGGMGVFMDVAKRLHDRGRKIAPHSWGAGGALMQNTHCAFAAGNTVILEVAPAYAGLHSEIVQDSFVMKDGMILPPEMPGLGIALTEETKAKYPFVPGSGEFISVPGKILTT